MTIQNIDAASLDAVLNQHDLVVLDFWAPWCQPCVAFSKIIEEVAPDYSDVLFAKINVDAAPELAEEFQVRSVPFVMILKSRVVVYADSGLLGRASLVELLEQAGQLTEEDLKQGES